MKRFKNILVVYGDGVGADDALDHAVALARANDARLTIIEAGAERYLTRAELAEREKRLKRVGAAVRGEGLEDVETVAVAGTPFLEIIRQVLSQNHDLVIAAAEGSRKLRNYFLGSTATHLMRKCPCPVWIVKPGKSGGYSRILCCIDPRCEEPKALELDRKIYELGRSLALKGGSELHIAHVWDVEGNDRDTISSEAPDHVRSRIIAEHEAAHRARVVSLMESYPQSELRQFIHLPRASEPQWAILELADQLDVDLIVMGTLCRTGIAGLFIGNAAESVLSQVNCGVFAVKPDGFVSPVSEESFATKAA